MQKILPAFCGLVLLLAGFTGTSLAQEEPKMEKVEKMDASQEIDQIEQNVNGMLQMLEALESDGSLSRPEEPASGPGLEGSPNTGSFEALVKPDASAGLPVSGENRVESSKKRIATEDEVVRFVAEDPDSHFRLGLEYWRSQNFDEAISHFLEVVRLAPENAHAHWNLGLLNDKKNNGPEAIAYLEKAEDIYVKYNYPAYAQEARQRLDELHKKYDSRP